MLNMLERIIQQGQWYGNRDKLLPYGPLGRVYTVCHSSQTYKVIPRLRLSISCSKFVMFSLKFFTRLLRKKRLLSVISQCLFLS